MQEWLTLFLFPYRLRRNLPASGSRFRRSLTAAGSGLRLNSFKATVCSVCVERRDEHIAWRMSGQTESCPRATQGLIMSVVDAIASIPPIFGQFSRSRTSFAEKDLLLRTLDVSFARKDIPWTTLRPDRAGVDARSAVRRLLIATSIETAMRSTLANGKPAGKRVRPSNLLVVLGDGGFGPCLPEHG